MHHHVDWDRIENFWFYWWHDWLELFTFNLRCGTLRSCCLGLQNLLIAQYLHHDCLEILWNHVLNINLICKFSCGCLLRNWNSRLSLCSWLFSFNFFRIYLIWFSQLQNRVLCYRFQLSCFSVDTNFLLTLDGLYRS